jgi:UDP-3-O-[3-hydroxymyristoyl] N-acetylglucosamine deacetylase
MVNKKTINKEIMISGIGIHTGKTVEMILKPSDSGQIVFKRTDVEDFESPLDIGKVDSLNCTMLKTRKGKIYTLEHLLAVLWVYGVDSLIVELNGGEVPIMDGSAYPFVQAVKKAGIRSIARKKSILTIIEPFIIKENGASISVSPDRELRVTYHISFEHPSIKQQGLSISVNQEEFEREIAPARTFGFLEDVPGLRMKGLALGGSLKNAVVLDKKRIISGPLRFPDEFARHKILDFIGDLSLTRTPVIGHFIAKKAGHALHLKMVKFLLDNPKYWKKA